MINPIFVGIVRLAVVIAGLAIIVSALMLILTGCGAHETSPFPEHYVSGEPFLPAYYAMLQGTQPFLTDDVQCPPAADTHALLIPCDTP